MFSDVLSSDKATNNKLLERKRCLSEYCFSSILNSVLNTFYIVICDR